METEKPENTEKKPEETSSFTWGNALYWLALLGIMVCLSILPGVVVDHNRRLDHAKLHELKTVSLPVNATLVCITEINSEFLLTIRELKPNEEPCSKEVFSVEANGKRTKLLDVEETKMVTKDVRFIAPQMVITAGPNKP